MEKLKLNDRVRNIHDRSLPGTIMQENIFYVKWDNGDTSYHYALFLEKLPEEENKMSKENIEAIDTPAVPYWFDPNYTPKLKLEMGKTYEVDLGVDIDIITPIYQDKDTGDWVCIVKHNNQPEWYKKEWLKNIKEHREPYKKTYLQEASNTVASIDAATANFYRELWNAANINQPVRTYEITIKEITEGSADE